MTHLTQRTRNTTHDPIIQDQLVSIGDSCLDLRAYPAWDAIMMGWAGCFVFIILSPINFPMFFEAFSLEINNSGNIIGLLFTIIAPFFWIAMTLGFSYFQIRHISKYSNIRFNRHTGKVYATVHGQRCEADWQNINAEISSRLAGGGTVVGYNTTLNIHMYEIDQPPKYPKLKLRGIIQPSIVTGGFHDGAICVWEFICIYMEEGPSEKLMFVKPEGYLKTARKISLPPKENFWHYFPWPITTAADDFGWKVIKRILWPAKIIIFPVAVASQFLWHIMYTTFKGQFPPLPEESEQGCDKNRLTVEDFVACGDPEEKIISYQQALTCKQHHTQTPPPQPSP